MAGLQMGVRDGYAPGQALARGLLLVDSERSLKVAKTNAVVEGNNENKEEEKMHLEALIKTGHELKRQADTPLIKELRDYCRRRLASGFLVCKSNATEKTLYKLRVMQGEDQIRCTGFRTHARACAFSATVKVETSRAGMGRAEGRRLGAGRVGKVCE